MTTFLQIQSPTPRSYDIPNPPRLAVQPSDDPPTRGGLRAFRDPGIDRGTGSAGTITDPATPGIGLDDDGGAPDLSDAPR